MIDDKSRTDLAPASSTPASSTPASRPARPYPVAVVSRKAETALRGGHVWVYDTEVRSLEGGCANGDPVDIRSEKGAYLGTGYISERSKIRLRLITRDSNERVDDAFYRRRVRYALDYRKTVMGADTDACRLIFGESDGLPGLTVDRYGDILVSQVLSVGTDKARAAIYRALCELLRDDGCRVSGIYERNDAAIRELEGLPQYRGWYDKADFVGRPATPLTQIRENGVLYAVDVENGQKTGFFLDQKYNCAAVAKLARGKRVLDCFTHTGSFALNAAMGGAERVTAVDVSASAVEFARENARLNGIADKLDFVCADVFDLLPELCERRERYDMIILDPPAFTKSRRTVAGAERGYREINYRAMKLLPRGGYLATCSCSHFMTAPMFLAMLEEAAADAGVLLKLVEARRQSPDHPTLLRVPETDYLKFYILQII